MSVWIQQGLLGAGGILLLIGAAYAYFIYSPVPNLPFLSASVQERTIQVGSYTRTYLAYVPARLPPNPALVLVLHGSKINGTTMRKWTGYEFDELADQHGFIVLYPDGYKNNWNDCRKTAPFAAKKENIDDVGFMKALVDSYKTTNGVNPANVFAFGYSNGGQMAFRLAIEQPHLMAAIAVIAANFPTPDNLDCERQGPTPPLMLVSNTADHIMPYQGGEVKLLGTSYGRVLSARATALYFAGRNGPGQMSESEKIASTAGTNALPVERVTWTKANQSMVVWYTVRGGGHVVPQPCFRFPRFNGQTATNLDTPAQAIAFFGLLR